MATWLSRSIATISVRARVDQFTWTAAGTYDAKGKPMKQYAKRSPIDLDKSGGYYCRHVAAMTEEELHSKADIAAELAYRDMRIAELEAQMFNVNRFEMIDHLSDEGGRFFSTGVRKPFRVELSFQDQNRTLKVFLTPKE